MRHDLTTIQVKAVVDHLRDMLGEDPDEQLLLDTLEGETDAFELVARLLGGIERDEGDVNALDDQIANRRERRDRCEKRIDGRREAITAIMQCAGLAKLPLPEASITLRQLADKLEIVDEDAVPGPYQIIKTVPDKKAINEAYKHADELPNWLVRKEGAVSITIRRK